MSKVRDLYHQIDFKNTSHYVITDASTPYEWSEQHYKNVVSLRQEALDKAREVWADYLMVSNNNSMSEYIVKFYLLYMVCR